MGKQVASCFGKSHHLPSESLPCLSLQPRRQIGTVHNRPQFSRDLEQGQEAARLCTLSLLANLKGVIEDLDNVRRIVKVLGFVNSDPEFGEQPKVINGCSDLLVDVFGERGRHARSAIGVAALPFGIAVEIEMIVEVEQPLGTS